jgi:aminoglycoside phosphotransferase family enzyme
MSAGITAPDGAREQLAATVAALRRPTAYPDAEGPVEAIETHMAWVFLTEEHAYKLKKPIRARLIDHTTVEARRRACYTELELNRRLAAPVYRAVVPVAETKQGLRVDETGPPVDWLVKMRRLPRDRMLDACIEQETVERAHVDRLGAKLSDFYLDAESVRWTGDEYRSRLTANLDAKCTSLKQPRYDLDPAAIQAVVEGQVQWLDEHGPLLNNRADRVVDAHGDLRPEHICLTDAPMVIDCLEFSRSLRLLDPLSELAFLNLECRRLGAEWIGNEVLACYRQRTGDDAPTALIPFYESYHALVRAAIAVWHLDDTTFDDADVWRAQAETYLRLAQERL